MDEVVASRRMRGFVVLGVLMTLAARYALAETLSDPTRPAIGSEQAPAVEGVTAPQVGVGMVVTAKEGVMALMDGRILRVGSRTDGGVVVRIAPDAVFVRSTEGKLTRLPLYPAVSMQTSVTPQSTPEVGTSRGKNPGKAREQKHGHTEDRSANK